MRHHLHNKILFLLTLLVGFYFLTPAAQAATFTVDTLTDENDGSCSDGDCSLRDAIVNANATTAADEIVFSVDGTFLLTATGSGSLGDLDITEDLTITGNGQSLTVIDGNATSNIIEITTDAIVSFADLTLQNGAASGRGGGIYMHGSSVTAAPQVSLTRVTVKQSTSFLGGGAVACQSFGSLTVTSSTLTLNESGTGGGAISNESCDFLSVSLSEISENTGGSNGGGIFNSGNTQFTVSQSLISDNLSSNNGGGIYNAATSTLSLVNTTLVGNTATNGGGLYNYNSSTTTAQNVTITANIANGTLSRGGGIYNNLSSSTTIKNSIVYLNTSALATYNNCYNLSSSSLISSGYNFIPSTDCSYTATTGDVTSGSNLSLDSLADNGGATRTLAIDTSDAAYNTGDCYIIGSASLTISDDQRDFERDATCDMGAFEYLPRWYQDLDNDGYGNSAVSTYAATQPTGYVSDSSDCDDGVVGASPSAVELCGDGVDNDCDALIDENDASDALTWYADVDADTYGSAVSTTTACTQPSGYVANNNDCNDSSAESYQGATEICDLLDNNCDGDVDEFATGRQTWYQDVDGDTYGVAGSFVYQCFAPSGYVSTNTDCDDANAAIYPTATEICDAVDNNCSGAVDEGMSDVDVDGTCDALDAETCDGIDNDGDALIDEELSSTTYYQDSDNDGYGNVLISQSSCNTVAGYVVDATDCDDANSAVHPTAVESCDAVDNDCDTTIDESGASGETVWYQDVDTDGFGSALTAVNACNQPEGYVANDTDCNDALVAINPLATEVCDVVDNDCDGSIDESGATGEQTWYEDLDADGFGHQAVSSVACTAPLHYVADNTDCNDASALAYPAATEVCDSLDNDCDGTTDENDATDASTWYADVDTDGYGDSTVSTLACEQPLGFVLQSGDCNDADAATYPTAVESCSSSVDLNCDGFAGNGDNDGDGYNACVDCNDGDADINTAATESCDAVDNDCDGNIDESGATGETTWFADVDGDGYGDLSSTTFACSQPVNAVANSSDCNDADGAVRPGAVEECDGIDNNCDANIDPEGSVGALEYYRDADGDEYGSAIGYFCSLPEGYVTASGDCDDASAAFNPAATEACGETQDLNCDGVVIDADSDGDGYLACVDDCDDANSNIHPAASELCDSFDNNCDGDVDENTAVDALTWFQDTDADGFGAASLTTAACLQPVGFVADNTDCDDTVNSINPEALEICANGSNDDCDAATPDGELATWYADTDGDGFGDVAQSLTQCGSPVAYVANSEDCDDARIDFNPDATELCDEIDNDCDDVVDDGLDCTVADTEPESGNDDTPADDATPGDAADEDPASDATPSQTDDATDDGLDEVVAKSTGGCSLQLYASSQHSEFGMFLLMLSSLGVMRILRVVGSKL